MTAAQDPLPHWDLTPFFPGIDSTSYQAAFDEVVAGIAALGQLFDAHGVRAQPNSPIDDALVAAVDEVITRTNALAESTRTLHAYTHGLVATDSANTAAQARASELRAHTARLDQLHTRLTAWLGSLDAETLAARSTIARAHKYALRQASIGAQHQMSELEEALAADLNPSSGAAWFKLHGDISSRLSVAVTVRGELKRLPMSALRNLAYDPDPATRRAGYAAELAGWQTVAVPLASALNGIKGEVVVLAQRRGWPDALTSSLHENAIDAPTLAAMQLAVVEALPDFRRYFRAKAHLLGGDQLPWWDLFAPVGRLTRPWHYGRAADVIVDTFGRYSPRLAALARRAFDERWIDAEPRPGKRGGGFCMAMRGDEFRILVNHEQTLFSTTVVAHELGHAYHNLCLAKRTYLQRILPMTLAETASTFCQILLEAAALDGAQVDERLPMLEVGLQNAGQVVVDIYARFLFETTIFERRRERELSADELCEAMVAAQRASYGDGLTETALHPYLWASKPHFFTTWRSFYNYPYTFGLLFSLGLYAVYQRDPAGFVPAFDDLLSRTGMADAATLAADFGIDLRTPDFWRRSLDVVRAQIDHFVDLASGA